MQDVFDKNTNKLKKIRVRKKRSVAILFILSLIVSLEVFWSLRQPGLTLAGDADCGIIEHTHDDACKNEDSSCSFEEHIHDIFCYSDDTADIETQLDWQKMFEDYPYTKNLREDLVGIAKTQVGYTESTLNFQFGNDGIRRGYTRYGAWYGTPYTDWSATFVSFCLNYAGADMNIVPGNTGANSMAEIWRGLDKYSSVGEYTPKVGDLVFFKNNTVGIIAEIQNGTFYVIRGDIDNAVRGEVIPLTDSSIAGWGLTVGTVHSNKEPSKEELLDITNGPAFFIFEGNYTQKRTRAFARKTSRSIINIIEYLEENDGSYFFTLLDIDNHELPKDSEGNYIAYPDNGYKLTVSFTNPNGFVPGVYQYQVPNGLLVDGGEGIFILKDGINVGDWTVTDEGLITLNFNEHMNSRTEITISATMGIRFREQKDPIDFDGKITVTVQKPEEEEFPTKVYKWGSQGNEENNIKSDPTKIYWSVQIIGDKDSQIIGSVLTDRVLSGQWSKPHKFTASDIAGGLTFGVSEPDPVTGGEKAWHSWKISPDDPNLTWTEEGWSYIIPETATCQWCGKLDLGNAGWSYTIEYTSTPDPTGAAGTFGYENEVEVDKQYAYSWVDFTQGDIHGEISKNGSFISDASGSSFRWEFQATIPGLKDGQKSDYFWYIMEYMDIRNTEGGLLGYITNDVNKATVTATHNGQTIVVPHIHDATVNDPFAWHNYWSDDHGDGIYNTRQLNLLCKCNCTEENCRYWNNGRCGSEYWFEGKDGYWYTNGYCQCWTEKENTTFTFVYETDDISMVEKYGGVGNQLRNEAVLYNRTNGPTTNAVISSTQAFVKIPGLFKKELTQDFDGYTAHYKITINEGKLVLTDGTPLTINDVMTETLVFISGSLVITAEDINGNITTLKQGEDYTLTYDGTGNITDSQDKKVHVLDIVILRPQPVTYILDYDTTLIIPTGVTEAVKYSNSASITLWDQKITDTSTEKVYADINIAAKNYRVEMFKTCASSGNPLARATFGLFNERGGLIATSVTDAKGELFFQSNIIEGVIFREHMLYYIQELIAPPGYQLDDKKYWFCFCDETNKTCKTCMEILAETEGQRIPFEEIGKVHATNQVIKYNLPATGGSGTYHLILVSVIFIVIPLVYRFNRRRKRERRGDG